MNFVDNLLSFITPEEFRKFAAATGVDKHTKKLHGELLFKLLLYCLVTEKDNSLRGMQSAMESTVFRALANISGNSKIAHSSISERLNVINPSFFETIFKHCLLKFGNQSNAENKNIVRFDSTIVSLSTSLINIGYNLKGGDAGNHRLLKFTVGYSNLPECICFYTAQTYNSENVALTETIVANQKSKKQINVFDRGITSRDNYDKLTENKILFISRINPNPKQELIEVSKMRKPIQTNSLIIESDKWVNLYNQNQKKTAHPVRLVECKTRTDGASMVFITNIKDLKALEITEIYKSRWDIEIFFKYIKQHLNFSHLLNRTENGIKVVMYATMIVAILIAEYKKRKNIKGFKIPKRKLAQELENDLIYAVVIACNGNANLAKQIIYRNSS
jgi:hypothetical protein